VAKHIKKQIRSTTLCLDWHPNNALIAAGGSDFKCRIFVAYVPEVDGQKAQETPWGSNLKPADCVAEFAASNRGWVHACAFNFSGTALAFVGHDSCVYMVDGLANSQQVLCLRTPFLPFLSFKWISDKVGIAAGHDCYPVTFSFDSSGIKVLDKLQVSSEAVNSK
jgi:actin related protein 2/3 complex subunit 1A/1B